MSSYVKRERDGRIGYVGPIRSPRQAEKERAAWESCGWQAEVLDSTPETRRLVREWVKSSRAARS